MQSTSDVASGLDQKTCDFYCQIVTHLDEAGIPFLVGGAYALQHHTGITRHTKDFDVFVTRADCERTLQALEAVGFRAERTFPHWLGKVFGDDAFIDVIFGSGNGVAEVDAEWFAHAEPGELFGVPVRVIPAEEMIWSKGYIMERERYDGADIAHLLRASGRRLDWDRLLRRFGPDWRVLLSILVLFGYVYPGELSVVPAGLLDELMGRLRAEQENPPEDERLCRGTLLSREQYLPDIRAWGYQDARLKPRGKMSAEAIAHWTAAI